MANGGVNIPGSRFTGNQAKLTVNGGQRRGPNTGESFHRQSGKVDGERRPTAGSKYRGVVSPAIKRRLTAIGGDEVGGAMASVAPESSWS